MHLPATHNSSFELMKREAFAKQRATRSLAAVELDRPTVNIVSSKETSFHFIFFRLIKLLNKVTQFEKSFFE